MAQAHGSDRPPGESSREIGDPSGNCAAAMWRVSRTIDELIEEAKRRTVLFVLLVVVAAYCMSLTSNSVLINIPIAVIVVALLRRLFLELEVRIRPDVPLPRKPRFQYYCKYMSVRGPSNQSHSSWKHKIDSPVVEAAVDNFVQRLVAEWITDCWYSALTPDREAPQEIRALVDGVIGEIALRTKQVNLINLLTRDVVNVVSSHLELYREAQASIGKELFGTLSSEERDQKIKCYLASANKLHPAVRSLEMEIQVLQRLMGGLLSVVLKPEDAQCKVLVCIARELLACAVMRPVLNFASPSFINMLIEALVKSSRQEPKSDKSASGPSQSGRTDLKRSTTPGVELIDVGQMADYEEQTKRAPAARDGMSSTLDTLSTAGNSGDWGHALDALTQKKSQALAPEHLDNLWAKGRNYKKKEISRGAASGKIAELEPLVLVEAKSGNEEMSELQDFKRPGEQSLLLGKTATLDNDFYSRPQDKTDRLIMVGEDSIGVHSGTATSRVIHHPLETPEQVKESPPRHHRSRSTGGLEGLDNREKTASSFDMGTRRMATATLPNYKSKLSCRVIGAHYEKTGSKSFAVYSISVTDAEDRTWVVLRRFRNFEQLHRRLRDMPHYSLSLPPKRFLSSNLDNSFVRERCFLLNKYLKDLLSIPSIAELHEVWDFLSSKSQNYGFGESVSIMKTLAVNVDDAVDDVFRQFKGVSKKATVSDSVTWNPPLLASSSFQSQGASQHSDDDGEDDFRTGWHSDSEVHAAESRLGRSAMDTLSDGHSPVESLAGSDGNEDEWIPPKLTGPLLHLVDVVFQLEGRGWIRRQVLWMAKQVLQLGMGDAIDDWLLSRIQHLRREEAIASGIKWIEEVLWPDGVFVTKHSGAGATSTQPSFEEGLEAARRASVVRELIQERAPSALVSLIGRKQYQRCAKDIYGFLQSSVCLKQLAFSLLEKLIAAAFPELEELISEVSEVRG